MKIECVKTHHERCHLDTPFGFSQWYYNQRNVLIIEVITDTGVSGWGACYGPAEIIQSAVEHFYSNRIIGLDALSTDMI